MEICDFLPEDGNSLQEIRSRRLGIGISQKVRRQFRYGNPRFPYSNARFPVIGSQLPTNFLHSQSRKAASACKKRPDSPAFRGLLRILNAWLLWKSAPAVGTGDWNEMCLPQLQLLLVIQRDIRNLLALRIRGRGRNRAGLAVARDDD